MEAPLAETFLQSSWYWPATGMHSERTFATYSSGQRRAVDSSRHEAPFGILCVLAFRSLQEVSWAEASDTPVQFPERRPVTVEPEKLLRRRKRKPPDFGMFSRKRQLIIGPDAECVFGNDIPVFAPEISIFKPPHLNRGDRIEGKKRCLGRNAGLLERFPPGGLKGRLVVLAAAGDSLPVRAVRALENRELPVSRPGRPVRQHEDLKRRATHRSSPTFSLDPTCQLMWS